MSDIEQPELTGALLTGEAIASAGAGARRVVRAGLLGECLREIRTASPGGLRLDNVVIAGRVDLTGLAVPFPLLFSGCEFDEAPQLEGARLFGLSLAGCRLPGLLANGLRVRRDLDVSGCTVSGARWTSVSTSQPAAVWLCEAKIGGRLLCAQTVIDGQGSRSIYADRIRVGGAVRLIGGFRAAGELRLQGARMKSSFDLNGVQLHSQKGSAIDLEGADITGNVFLIEDPSGLRPTVRGRIELTSARIGARLVLRHLTLESSADEDRSSVYERPAALGTALNGRRMAAAGVTVEGDCRVTGRIDLSMSDVGSLAIGGNCVLAKPGDTALDLTSATIAAGFLLGGGTRVQGSVQLAGAAVHGTLALHGELSRPRQEVLLDASAAIIGGDVDLDGLRADGGAVSFRSASVGSLSATGARLRNPGGYSLRLSQAVIQGPLLLTSGFASTGLVALNRTTVEGRMQLTGGSFTCPGPAEVNPDGHAIEAVSATVHGSIDLGWQHVSPSVDFTDATTTFLADDPATWPERFIISGLTYSRFDIPRGSADLPVWDAAARSSWLSRQSTFDSGPYEQAAKVFREHGYTRQAEQVLIAQHRQARKVSLPDTGWPRRAAGAVYGAIGYGYRPARVLWLLAALLVLVAASLAFPAARGTLRATTNDGVIYTTSGPLARPAAPTGPAAAGRSDSCGDGAVRCFSPALYAIDTVIPLISLDQRSTWSPDPNLPDGRLMLWWLNLATIAGWLLSSIFVVSLARLSRNA